MPGEVWQRSSTFKVCFLGGGYLLWVPTTGRGESHPSQSAFLSLSSEESHIKVKKKKIECIISWFLKGNCVSRVRKTHSTSAIEIHPRKRWTRSSGLPQLPWMVRGLNDSRRLFTGEQQLSDTMPGFLRCQAAENQQCLSHPGLFSHPKCRKVPNSYVTVWLRVTNSATASRSTWVKQSHFRIILM